MVNTSYTADGMNVVGKRFTDGVANIKSYRATLQGQMDDLARRWGGQASTTFHKVMGDWGQQHDIIIAQLQDIADKLGHSSILTTNVEQSNNSSALTFFNH